MDWWVAFLFGGFAVFVIDRLLLTPKLLHLSEPVLVVRTEVLMTGNSTRYIGLNVMNRPLTGFWARMVKRVRAERIAFDYFVFSLPDNTFLNPILGPLKARWGMAKEMGTTINLQPGYKGATAILVSKNQGEDDIAIAGIPQSLPLGDYKITYLLYMDGQQITHGYLHVHNASNQLDGLNYE